MEEVERLQAVFRELQKKDAKHKLSDRNVVEVVLKLLELKKLDLIFSLNGKEYITPNQLEREINDCLLEHGGRIAILELQPLLNVDLEHIERKVNEMVKTDPDVHCVDGEVVTKYYLDQVGEEINETLQDTGAVNLSDLGKRFGLYSDFLKEAINARLGRIIRGKLQNGMLYTDAYVARYTARIRGLLSGVTRPTAVAQIQTKYDLQADLFHAILERLVNEGRLDGTLQGQKERAQYLPTVYNNTRQRWLEEYFTANGHIDYKTVEKMGVGEPRTYLASRFPGSVALRQHLVAGPTIQQTDEAMCEALQSAGWATVAPLVPFLSQQDAASALESCTALLQQVKKGDAFVLAEVYAVSKDLIERALRILEERHTEKVRAAGPTAAAPAAAQDAADSDAGKKKKGGRGGKGDKGEGKGKKGENDIDEDSLKEIRRKFEGMEEELLTAMLDHMRPQIAEMKQRVTASVFVEAAGSQKSRHQAVQEEINALYISLHLYREGAKELQLSAEDGEMLEKHLLRSVGTPLVCALVQEQAVAHALPTDQVTPANRAEVTARLPASAAKILDRLAKLLTGKSVDPFVTDTDAAAEALQIKLPGTDKRTLRDALLAHREQLKSALETETSPPTALQLAVLLFFHRCKQRALHLPTKLISKAIDALQKLLAPASFSVLSSFSTGVVELLRLRAEAQREGGGNAAREQELEAQLTDALPALKAAVFAPETEEEKQAAKAAASERKRSEKEDEEAPAAAAAAAAAARRKGKDTRDEGKEEKKGGGGKQRGKPKEKKEARVEDEVPTDEPSPAPEPVGAAEEPAESEASPATAKSRRKRAQQ